MFTFDTGDIARIIKSEIVMINEFQTFKELTDKAAAYLKSLSYGSQSIDSYSREWSRLGDYMRVNGVLRFDSGAGVRYLAQITGNIEVGSLSRKQRNQIRAISVLSDFAETGTIRKRKKKQAPKELNGPIGKVMSDYIIQAKSASGLATGTVQSYHLYLSVFLDYLDSCGIILLERLDRTSIINFVKYLKDYSVITRHLIILKSNQFLKYLYDNQVVPIDYSKVMPKDKYVRQPKLPSYYSPEEVSRLIGCIDRSNPNGKRNYAMILLMAILGLRSSDVANLEFANILWEQELVSLKQQKTKEPVELPLFPEIGNAIIDYLKYGRPQSDLSTIFLRHVPPYDGINKNLSYMIVKKYVNLSGIKYDERRHGPHALRHSLATNLLKKEVSLPVISSVLGHTCSASTMSYLRIDTNSLRKCALEVPAIAQGTRKEAAL